MYTHIIQSNIFRQRLTQTKAPGQKLHRTHRRDTCTFNTQQIIYARFIEKVDKEQENIPAVLTKSCDDFIMADGHYDEESDAPALIDVLLDSGPTRYYKCVFCQNLFNLRTRPPVKCRRCW